MSKEFNIPLYHKNGIENYFLHFRTTLLDLQKSLFGDIFYVENHPNLSDFYLGDQFLFMTFFVISRVFALFEKFFSNSVDMVKNLQKVSAT